MCVFSRCMYIYIYIYIYICVCMYCTVHYMTLHYTHIVLQYITLPFRSVPLLYFTLHTYHNLWYVYIHVHARMLACVNDSVWQWKTVCDNVWQCMTVHVCMYDVLYITLHLLSFPFPSVPFLSFTLQYFTLLYFISHFIHIINYDMCIYMYMHACIHVCMAVNDSVC